VGDEDATIAGSLERTKDSRASRCALEASIQVCLEWAGSILIVEGLNVLQTGRLPRDGAAIPFVSDFFDFSVYLDADENVLRGWYVDRFLTLRGTAFRDPKSYFHRYSNLSDEEAVETATSIWERINLLNLYENILPTRQRADLILKKGASHMVEEVALRKL